MSIESWRSPVVPDMASIHGTFSSQNNFDLTGLQNRWISSTITNPNRPKNSRDCINAEFTTITTMSYSALASNFFDSNAQILAPGQNTRASFTACFWSGRPLTTYSVRYPNCDARASEHKVFPPPAAKSSVAEPIRPANLVTIRWLTTSC